MDVAHRVGLRGGDVERTGLAVVVAEHLGRDVVGHRGEQGVALLAGEVAVPHDPVEQDLDVDLVVGAVHPGRVVDRVGVDVAAAVRELDAAPLGEAEVSALADDPAPQLGRVDPDRVVVLVADVGVRLGRRLDVGADPAVPQQVHRRPEDRADELVRGSASASTSRARRISSDSGTDLAVRENTPPPGEINAGS